MSSVSSTADLKSFGSTAAQRQQVPVKWRIGQAIVSLIIVAIAIYYNTRGWMTGPQPLPGDARTVVDQLGFVILLGLVWFTTPVAGVLAASTFYESVRKRWLLVLLAFSLVLIVSSVFFTGMQPGAEAAFLRDYGIGFIVAMTLLMSIFLGVSLVPPEIERRTIFTILTKPVNRMEFIMGKFLGLCLTLLVNLVLMVIIFYATYIIFNANHQGMAALIAGNPEAGEMGLKFDLFNLTSAFILQFGQLAIMAALSLVMSLVVSHITALVGAFVIYFAGQMSSYWGVMGGSAGAHAGHDHGEEAAVEGMSKAAQGAMKMFYYILPRLDQFDVRTSLVQGSPVMFNYVWKAWSAGLIYVGALLIIGYLVFSDREF